MMQNLSPDGQNVFAGPDALKVYLDPQNGVYTPLVEMPVDLNPYAEYNVRIYAKLLNTLPLGNVKSIPAFHMLSHHTAQPTQKKIIESSSGNTVASMGILAPYFGFSETHALVSHEVTAGKLKMLQLFGVHPIINREPICPSENDQSSGIHKARKLGRGSSWYNPDQYGNPANIEAHYTITGPQIWDQMGGKVDYFAAGMGTTGTLIGTSSFLKNQNKNIQTIGVVRAPNNPVPGPRTKNLLNDVAFDWNKHCDEMVDIGTIAAYEMSLAMVRKGLLVGPSSGMALAGLLDFIESKKDMLNPDKETSCVFICCDSAIPYVDEYFKYLSPDRFPEIKNKNLLQSAATSEKFQQNTADVITAPELYKALEKDPDIKLIDLRSEEWFSDHHIPRAVNVPEGDFISNINMFSKLYANKQAVLICGQGEISALLTPYAKSKGIQAMTLEGGMIEWSRQHLPREKNAACPV
jgi:cysteine synthase/rhodanese-related sulfurtransferase